MTSTMFTCLQIQTPKVLTRSTESRERWMRQLGCEPSKKPSTITFQSRSNSDLFAFSPFIRDRRCSSNAYLMTACSFGAATMLPSSSHKARNQKMRSFQSLSICSKEPKTASSSESANRRCLKRPVTAKIAFECRSRRQTCGTALRVRSATSSKSW